MADNSPLMISIRTDSLIYGSSSQSEEFDDDQSTLHEDDESFVEESAEILPEVSLVPAKKKKAPKPEVPIKRGRGRPRKISAVVAAAIADGAEETPPPPPPKRGRGRPRKTQPKEEYEEEVVAIKPKRGRGRPRKRPLEEPAVTPPVEPPVTPKRGRGRPKKIQKITDSQGIAVEAVTPPPKRGRGRPRKKAASPSTIIRIPSIRGRGRPPKASTLKARSKSTGALETSFNPFSPSPLLAATRPSLIEEENQELGYESDVAHVLDLEEEISIFAARKGKLHCAPSLTRGEQLWRSNRTLEIQKHNKNLIAEERLSVADLPPSIIFTRYLEALRCHFPSSLITILRIKDKSKLLCPSCGREKCHGRCPIRISMVEVHSTLQWMKEVNWEVSQEFGMEWKPLEEAESSERKLRFQAATQSMNINFQNESMLYQALDENAQALVYMSNKLRVKEIRSIRFQRSIYRLLHLKLDCMTLDDIRLAYKFINTLGGLKGEAAEEVEKLWIKTKKGNAFCVDYPHLKCLVDLLDALFGVLGGKVMSFDDSLPVESSADEFGLNFNVVESAAVVPLADPLKEAMFCVIPSRHSPSEITMSLLRCLGKEFTFTVTGPTVTSMPPHTVSTCNAIDSIRNTEIMIRAHNLGERDVHLMIRISSAELKHVQALLMDELKKSFRRHDEIQEKVSFLPYHIVTSEVNLYEQTILLTATTGENDALPYPSTHITATLLGEVVSKMVITYCNNEESQSEGPTIQLFAVKKAFRGQGLGNALLTWLESSFLSSWFPVANNFYLYASYVCSSHGFFEKQGFTFYDFYNEEARKQVVRKKVGRRAGSSHKKSASTLAVSDVQKQVSEAQPMDTNE